ncbi:MAG: hypothetical protein JW940_23035 [Polyangiaceae bacterium]|nr:hypothetical protein [Polyangiaceae bacterium]
MCNSEQRWSWALVAWLGLLLSSCGGSTGQSSDSETHFLRYCDGSCSGGLRCVCGVCTKACEKAATCRDISEAADCVAPTGATCESSAPERVCDVLCDADGDCADLGDRYQCYQGACRQGTPPSAAPQAGAGGAGEAGAGTGGARAAAGAPHAGGSTPRAGAPGTGGATVGGAGTGGADTGGAGTGGADTGGAGTGGAGTGGAGTGGADTGGAGAATTCYAALDADPVDLDAPSSAYAPAFASTEDGFVGVAPGADGGYAITRYGADGALQGSVETLWPEVQYVPEAELAVSGDVLAIVDLDVDKDTQRQVCRLAMVGLADVTALREPTRYSDAPTSASVLNEADACGLVAVDGGFVVLWHAQTSDTSDESTLFAQGYDLDGNQEGDRLALAVGDKRSGLFSAASDGTRAAVVVAGSKDAALELAFIEDGQLSAASLDPGVSGLSDIVELAPARDGFIARAGDELSVLDRDGRLLHGPVSVDSTVRVAPLDAGYVLVSNEEYLVARTLDAELGELSDPTAISNDRAASASQLLYAPDGSRVGLIYNDSGQRRFVRLVCSDTPPASPGPSVCPTQPQVSPLDDGCTDPVCHVLVRLDYLTLGLRGWAAIGGDSSPVDSEAATTEAQAVFDENSEYLSSPTASGPSAGLFTVIAQPSDFGAFALVGEQSGLVVSAGGVVWSGTGHYWVPSQWNDPAGIACAAEATEAAETYLDPGECASEGTTPATAAQALNVVLRSNLAAHLAEQGPFSAFAFLYTPTVGACSPEIAEYLVVLTQAR